MIFDVSLVEYGLYLVVIIFASLVHGTIGLGFPLVATPLLSIFIDVRTAILITLLPTIGINIISIWIGGKWRESIGKFWPLAFWALIGSIIGSYILVFNDPAPFKLLLALLVFLYLAVERSKSPGLGWFLNHPRLSKLCFGLTAGLSAGTTNVMVPILIIYSLELGWHRTLMVQVFNMTFLSGKVAQVGVFATEGILDGKLIQTTLPLLAVACITLLVGYKIGTKIPADIFRKIIKFVLFLLGVILFVQFCIEFEF